MNYKISVLPVSHICYINLPMKDLIVKIVLLLGVVFVTCRIAAQDARLGQDEKELILRKTAEYLRDNYVIPDIGIKYYSFVMQQLKKGVYNKISHPRRFAEQLTKDIQRIHKDEHIRVISIWPDQQQLREQDPLLAFFLNARQDQYTNFGLKEVQVFPGNIGYLNIISFEAPEQAEQTLDNAMNFLRYCDAIIIDLRQNSGGSIQMVQYLCSYFFSKPVHLNSYYWRRGDYEEKFRSLEHVNGEKKPDTPLFILIGPVTFSAGEEFAYDLQAQKRALLIGEKTGGGAHPGRRFTLNERFRLFIPTGRAINPVTGSSWENAGVRPDIEVRSNQALAVALEKAKLQARIYREKKDNSDLNLYLKLSENLKKADTLLIADQADSARVIFYPLLESALNTNAVNEWIINNLGYKFLSERKYDLAILILEFNTLHFPGSANSFDSLGEAYMRAGNIQKAIENYQKSLQLNPYNNNAQLMLEQLNKEK